MGQDFVGVYHLTEDKTYLYEKGHGGEITVSETREGYDYPDIRERLGKLMFDAFEESLELVQMALEDFNTEEFLKGEMTPVLFGTALGNFGVNMVLDTTRRSFQTTAAPVGGSADVGFVVMGFVIFFRSTGGSISWMRRHPSRLHLPH